MTAFPYASSSRTGFVRLTQASIQAWKVLLPEKCRYTCQETAFLNIQPSQRMTARLWRS